MSDATRPEPYSDGAARRVELGVLLAAVASLVVVGQLCLRSSAVAPPGLAAKQLVWTALGAAVGGVLAYVGPQRRPRVGPWVFGVVVALVVATWVVSPVRWAHRWIVLGALRVQPAELLKLAIVLVLARVLVEVPSSARDAARQLGAWGAIVAVAVLPVAAQPNFATALQLVIVSVLVLAALSARRWVTVAALAGLSVAGIATLRWGLLSYQRARLDAFLHGGDPLGAGYQVHQSMTAFGAGRWLGHGTHSFGQALASRLPDAHTDFVATVWAYERGWVGTAVVLSLELAIVLVALRAGRRSEDRASRATCVGVAALVGVQVALHFAVVMGMSPVVGVGLPLVSYGGSNVVAVLAGVGLVASVLRRPA